MGKINGHRYEQYTAEVDEAIRQTLEMGWVLSEACDQERHSQCAAQTPDECWCECHEVDEGGCKE